MPIGTVIALISTESGSDAVAPSPAVNAAVESVASTPANQNTPAVALQAASSTSTAEATRFYSPLVKNIAKQENIGIDELENLTGSGQQGRVTKKDILDYIESKQSGTPVNGTATIAAPATPAPVAAAPVAPPVAATSNIASTSVSGNVEIVEMDRMRRLIADHMVKSKQTSPHVTSYVEVDMTNIVQWRDKVKDGFKKKYNENFTFTPIFIDAVAKAIRDFPMINISVDGNNIIIKKDINIGMAAALPTGNLIVPVIKNADQLNLIGLAKSVNDFATRARQNKLKPEEIQGGTFTLTNVGTFGSVMGTPIINQPQVAILAVGAIKKKPAVLETEYGDVIAIRQMMFMSLSYDHRVVDGSLGGSFLKRVADYLEKFDTSQSV